MDKIKIVIQAIPFCFGPGAQALAIGNELRQRLGKDLELIALGIGTTYEFLKMSGSFNEIYRYSSEKSISKKIKKILTEADKIIGIGDFEFIDQVYDLNRKVDFVDPLFWMWGEFPRNISKCNQYYAVDFPGVRKSVNEYNLEFPKRLKPIIVSQICEYEHKKIQREKGVFLIQFGGVDNPMGINIYTMLAMIEEISKSIKGVPSVKKILVRGGSKIMKIISKKIRRIDPRIEIGTSEHEQLLKELSGCEAVLTIPGMSIVYEAFASKTPLMFILPLNYSQHRQTEAYKKLFQSFSIVSWEDFVGYKTLPKGIPEREAIQKSIEMGKQFYSDNKAREKFKAEVLKFIRNEDKRTLRSKRSKESKALKINGAQEISKKIINELKSNQN